MVSGGLSGVPVEHGILSQKISFRKCIYTNYIN